MPKSYKIVIFGNGAVGQNIAYSLYFGGHNYAFVGKKHTVLDRNCFKLEMIHLSHGGKKITFHKVPSLNWKSVNSNNPLDFLLKADFIFITVGVSNIGSVGRFIYTKIGALQHRPHVVFFENDLNPEEYFLKEFSEYPINHMHFAIPDIISYRKRHNNTIALYPFSFFLGDKKMQYRLNNKHFKYVDNIKTVYLQRLFSHNTAHNMVAYLGHQKGYKTIREAINDKWIKKTTIQALHEASIGMSKKYDIPLVAQKKKAELELNKLLCKNFEDPLVRVGRSPLRKLRCDDRLVGPAILAYEAGCFPKSLCLGIAHLLFFKVRMDKESMLLTKHLKKYGVAHVLKKFGALDEKHPIALEVQKKFEEISLEIRQ